MENNQRRRIYDFIYVIITGIFSILLINLGGKVIKDFPKQPYLGILTIILAFLFFYFSLHIIQIKTNKNKVEKIEKEIERFKEKKELEEKILNTIKDIILLNNTKKKWTKKEK